MNRPVTFLSVVALGAGLMWSAPAVESQGAAPYRLVADWGQLPGGETWRQVPGMAIDRYRGRDRRWS